TARDLGRPIPLKTRLRVVDPRTRLPLPRGRARSTIEGMLWSDPENKPPKELRDAQDMMRRAGLLLALAMVVAMFVLGIR
ncbi:hypothetical protein AB0D03_20570, partial [Streptomyces halstedii]